MKARFLKLAVGLSVEEVNQRIKKILLINFFNFFFFKSIVNGGRLKMYQIPSNGLGVKVLQTEKQKGVISLRLTFDVLRLFILVINITELKTTPPNLKSDTKDTKATSFLK